VAQRSDGGDVWLKTKERILVGGRGE
jgi:hypothetical protein